MSVGDCEIPKVVGVPAIGLLSAVCTANFFDLFYMGDGSQFLTITQAYSIVKIDCNRFRLNRWR